jgi:hypothetical protein
MSTTDPTKVDKEPVECHVGGWKDFTFEETTAIYGPTAFEESSVPTSSSLFKKVSLAWAVGVSEAFVDRANIRHLSLNDPHSTLRSSVFGFVTELQSWLGKYNDVEINHDIEKEIASYAEWQMLTNFPRYNRAIKEISGMRKEDVPLEAVAQLLISSSDAASGLNSFLLGSSIESYLDAQYPILIDAAAKSLSKSRLDYSHAAKRMKRAASRTNYKYLKKQLTKISDQLSGEADGQVPEKA